MSCYIELDRQQYADVKNGAKSFAVSITNIAVIAPNNKVVDCSGINEIAENTTLLIYDKHNANNTLLSRRAKKIYCDDMEFMFTFFI